MKIKNLQKIPITVTIIFRYEKSQITGYHVRAGPYCSYYLGFSSPRPINQTEDQICAQIKKDVKRHEHTRREIIIKTKRR